MKEQTKILEVAGFMPAITGMRLPTQSKGDSYIDKSTGEFVLGKKDGRLALNLLNKMEKVPWGVTEEEYLAGYKPNLIERFRNAIGTINKPKFTPESEFGGNVHGKFNRGIIAWLDITAPRKIWSELDTYTIGVSPTSSTSTMYTLKKEIKDIESIDYTFFDTHTSKSTIDGFKTTLHRLSEVYGSVSDIPIDILKSAVPDGWLQRRIKAFSYPSLRGLYKFRKTHKLSGWQVICSEIEKLPYFNELLIGKKK